MEFIAKNKVRMHDTDMAGILYFARQFRFAHDTLEDFFEADVGLNFDDAFKKQKEAFVIVHCEADYLTSLAVGDPLQIHLSVERIGQTSFTLFYKIYRKDELVGTVKTVHVAVNTATRKKIEIPENIRHALKKYHTSL